jgi:hypothetical protein
MHRDHDRKYYNQFLSVADNLNFKHIRHCYMDDSITSYRMKVLVRLKYP